MVSTNVIYNYFPELQLVNNKEWAESAAKIWCDMFTKSDWNDLEAIPFSLKDNSGTLIAHTQATVKAALRIADDMMRVYPLSVNKDWIILSAVLHDVSKILEYKSNSDGSFARTEAGTIYQHAFLGAHYATSYGLSDEVVSIIMCHTPQSNVKMKFREGVIVMHAEAGVAASLVDYNKQMLEALL